MQRPGTCVQFPTTAMRIGEAVWRFLRTACSMPAGVVLLVVLASAAAVGMILPDEAARAYVYDRAWF